MSDGTKMMISKHLKLRCRYVINAGTKDEEVSDGFGSNSPFVTAILQSKAGSGDDHECHVGELQSEICRRVAEMDVMQTPTGGILDGDKGGIAYLALPSESKGVRIEFTPPSETAQGGIAPSRGGGGSGGSASVSTASKSKAGANKKSPPRHAANAAAAAAVQQWLHDDPDLKIKSDLSTLLGELRVGSVVDLDALDAAAQQIDEDVALLFGLGADDLLIDAIQGRRGLLHGNVHRLPQQAVGEPLHIGRHGGGEEQALALLRQGLGDAPDGRQKTEIQHTVRLIGDQDFGFVETNVTGLQVVLQTAWRGHQEFDAPAQAGGLRPVSGAADNDGHARAVTASIGLQAVGDLRRQFAGRAQDQRATGAGFGPALVLAEPVQQWQAEGGGFAGSGIGDTDDVVAGDDFGDGARLNRSRH